MRKALIMLGELSDSDIDWIAKVAVRRILPAGSVIIAEGREIQSLFIILEGLAVVTARGVELARLASGDLLGEISMIDKQPPAATVTADIETTLLALDRRQLAKKLRDDPGFGCRFYYAVAIFLADRLRSTNLRLAHSAAPQSIEEIRQGDELIEDVLDKVYLAGAKFDKLLKRSLGAP